MLAVKQAEMSEGTQGRAPLPATPTLGVGSEEVCLAVKVVPIHLLGVDDDLVGVVWNLPLLGELDVPSEEPSQDCGHGGGGTGGWCASWTSWGILATSWSPSSFLSPSLCPSAAFAVSSRFVCDAMGDGCKSCYYRNFVRSCQII